MWIYLLRHGIAEEPNPGTDDAIRSLTSEGRVRLTAAATSWQKMVSTPELVLTSPYLRARETATIFAKAVGYHDELRDENTAMPHSKIEDTLAVLEGEMLSQTKSLALVGHEPHLGYLLGSLLTGHSHLSIPLGRGMLVGLETESTTNVIAGLRFSLTQRHAVRLNQEPRP